MKWIVCQLGARRNYLVPRLLFRAQLLSRLFTDVVGNQGWPRGLHYLPEHWLSHSLKRLRNRIPPEIPQDLITSFSTFGIRYQWRKPGTDSAQHWNWGSREFARLISRCEWEQNVGLYLFTGAALDLQKLAGQRAKCQVLDQIMAPRIWEQRILHEERQLLSQYAHLPSEELTASTEEYCQRQIEEWKLADAILCGSQFVIDTLEECGGDRSKCHLVPCASGDSFDFPARHYDGRPLNVLTVGAVGPRKGAYYVNQVAQRLGKRFSFRMVGGIEFPDTYLPSMRAHLELTGTVARRSIKEHYQWADVFLLPSLCEGSAGATYEALSAGLPVICTHNTGSVVEDGVSGFIVPIRNVDTICEKLSKLDEDRQLLQWMAGNAKSKSLQFSQESYGHRLVETLARVNRDSGVA